MEAQFGRAAMLAFSIAVVFSALNVIADIPDGVVYTDVRKIVIRGDDAVLKCQFRGTPLAVYWKKGSDPRSAPNLITRFGDDKPTGSCIEDGACALGDDFSLILKRANMADTGRYICNASYYGGISHHNFTDVKIIGLDSSGIYTEPYVTGWTSYAVRLPCLFRVEAKRVHWERVFWNAGNIAVETICKYTEGEYEVLGDRRYNCSKNYALIIRDLNLTDEGNFTCSVSAFDGNRIEKSTVLDIKDPGHLNIYTDPYVTGWAGSSVKLPCNFTVEAGEVLWKRVHSDDRSKDETILRYTSDMSDGTEAPGASKYSWSTNYGLIISDLHALDEGIFTCLASTIDGIELKNSTVLAINANQSSTVIIIIIAVIVVFVVIVILFIIIRICQFRSYIKFNTGRRFRCSPTMALDCFRWIFCCKQPDLRNADIDMTEMSEDSMEPESELDILRKQLKKYRPGKTTGLKNTERFPEVINLGVVGIKGAGKSSLINSLSFALKNKFEDVVFSRAGGSGETAFRGPLPLTKHISIWYREIEDLSTEQIDGSLMSQISGEGGRNPGGKLKNGEMIHCPIFVHHIRTTPGPMCVFLKEFSGLVCYEYGRHVMVVITYKEGDEDSFGPFKDNIVSLGVPEEQIWSFRNYTKTHKNHCVGKNISYLEFLQMCLKIGEKNFSFLKNKPT